MKVLCYINHFFGNSSSFVGKSTISKDLTIEQLNEKILRRKKYILEVVEQLKNISGIEIKICGIEGFSLVPIDIDFSSTKENPTLLVYESLTLMTKFVNEYDYFINIEDDTFLPVQTFQNIIQFDKESLVNEILLPNRLEKDINNIEYCVDIFALPGFTQQRKKFLDYNLRVALNPHSAIIILSKEKMKYALSKIDLDKREIFLGTGMESAFAYFHSPFSLYRSENLEFHFVYHLDKWLSSPDNVVLNNKEKSFLSKITFLDFIPPIIMYMLRFVLRKVKGKLNDK